MRARARSSAAIGFAVAITAAAAGCSGGGIGGNGSVGAAGNCTGAPTGTSYQKGPNPTQTSVSSSRGPFSTSTARVTGQRGFAGGTIYYPTDASQGTYGGIVLAPPFMINSSANGPMAGALASHGFVVLAFDANSTSDFPSSRATQAKAALTYLTDQSSVANRVDRNRLAIGGYSMGGGATMEVARDLPNLKAALPMVPWNTIKSFSSNRVPTMFLAAENDSVASVSSHAIPFFNSLPATTPKAYIEVRGASHFMPSSPPSSTIRYAVSWMKRWVDNDTRYDAFLSSTTSDLSTFRSCFAGV